MSFQLYYTLNINLKNKISERKKRYIIKYSNIINNEKKEIMFMLIREYHNNDPEKKEQYYADIITNKFIQFDLNKLPVNLLEILYKFLKLDVNKNE